MGSGSSSEPISRDAFVSRDEFDVLKTAMQNLKKENIDLKKEILEKDIWQQIKNLNGYIKGGVLIFAIPVAGLVCYGIKEILSRNLGLFRRSADYFLLPEPWRKLHETMTEDSKIKEDLLKNMLEVLPQNISTLNVLLLGQAGSGKSSFVNACKTACLRQGRVCKKALDGAMTSDGITHKLTSHNLNIELDMEAHDLPIQLFDCRGLSDGDDGVLTEDIEKLCKGHIKSGYMFKPKEGIRSDDEKYRNDPQEKDKIHCIIFVLAADENDFVHESVGIQLKEIRDLFREDIPQVILLTKIDRIGTIDLKKIFSDKRVKEHCEKAASFLNFCVNDVFPQSNYNTEVVPCEQKDLITLFNIKTIMERANDRLN